MAPPRRYLVHSLNRFGASFKRNPQATPYDDSFMFHYPLPSTSHACCLKDSALFRHRLGTIWARFCSCGGIIVATVSSCATE
jgi:hypothetical protein